MKFGFIGSLLSGLGNLLGFGSRRELGITGGDRARPYIAPERLRPSTVYRGGKHSRIVRECVACFHNLSKLGACRNRMCKKFDAVTAKTHPDLLSLDRKRRLHGQARWAMGGKLALWGTSFLPDTSLISGVDY